MIRRRLGSCPSQTVAGFGPSARVAATPTRGPARSAAVRASALQTNTYPKISRLTISAPALSALSLPRATFRASGAIPQLVDGYSLSASTNCSALRKVLATSSGVSIVLLATSIAPTITFLPRISSIRSIGTCELWHSSEMMSMLDCCSLGNDSSY